MIQNQSKSERLYYLDWLRVLAVILLVPYHTGMIFVVSDFHIKNDVTSVGLTLLNAFIDNWHMPLFFLLAGASTWFALKKRPPSGYLKERLLRLIIPLVFGVLIIVPPQTFYERIQKSGFNGNFLQFYTHLFNGFPPEGNLTWNHLWFLFYLFFISVSVLPLILGWKSGRGASIMASFCQWTAQGRRIFLLFVPLAFIQMTLKVAFPGPQNIISDWARIFFMLVIFLYGVMFSMFPRFQESLERNFNLALATGVAIWAFHIILYLSGYRVVFGYNLPNLILLGLQALAAWCWLIALLTLAKRTINFSNSFLEYASEAVLPFYIIHQTIVIILGYYIVLTDLSLMIKYILINILSLLIIVAIYEIIVRRFDILRFLFGMRSMPKMIAK